ncbi:MAG: class I SAM-dependent methyltransferase [Acidimicrobiales bacterium]
MTTPPSMPVMDQAFWDQRYAAADQIWSGNPNPHLVADASNLAPGRALDVGAGEGADAIWLAEQGWTVTAVDISPVALDRGRLEAERRGDTIANRITWVQLDVLSAPLPEGPFDLISLQFMHFGPEQRTPLFERCIAAVAPGGTLLIVAHHPSDLKTSVRRPKVPEFFYTAEEIAGLLGDGWSVVDAAARPREATDPEGVVVTIHDTVLLARRKG